MAADSPARRLAKRLLHPLLDDRTYKYIQAAAMSWDIWRGNWSEPELDLLPSLVKPGDVVLDVGANYGLYSHYMGRLVGPSGHVYAFEPIPFTAATFDALTENAPYPCCHAKSRVFALSQLDEFDFSRLTVLSIASRDDGSSSK